MPRPCQHAHAANASPARESAWSEIFGRNAPTIRQFQFPCQILPTLLQTPPTLTPGINFITPTIKETTFLSSSPVTPTTATTTAFALTTTTFHQRWGLSPKLFSMRPHVHLMHRPCRSLANPWCKDS
ncbi:unnamed protein product [Schistocephalus solidus]|uniref:Uncharacterized protein n=1 Tax=Schistocephalus solidus TaxID=70667 RepID=A0A183TIH9_SCHSO|nr:unnamed protein product [Schistocephalus solidus]